MKTIYFFLTYMLLLLVSVASSFAQINLQCNGNDMHSIYLAGSGAFYRIDSVDTNPSSPVLVATHSMGIGGLGISSLQGQETMYFISSTVGNTYHYWNGSAWINTNHAATGTGAINLGGTADYIFNLDGSYNSLYRYDGTGNDVLLVSNLGTTGGAIFDVATDNQGNFYLFYTTGQKIKEFNPSGIPVDSFTTTSFPSGGGPGFAIIGNRMYAVSSSSLYEGIKSGNNINFTVIASLPVAAYDIASCPQAGNPLAVFKNPDMPHFAVYPNPASGYTTIKLDNAVSFEITDCLGKQKTKADTRGLTEYKLSLYGWKPGVYFMKVHSKNNSTGCAAFAVY